jgi:hypothetical protein
MTQCLQRGQGPLFFAISALPLKADIFRAGWIQWAHVKRPRRASLECQIKNEQVSTVEGLPYAATESVECVGGGEPTGKRNGNYRNGTRTKDAIQPVRLVSRTRIGEPPTCG